MAVLSVMAHGDDLDADRATRMGLAAVAAWHDLDTAQSSFYIDVVFAALGDAARGALEALMESSRYPEFQSDIARKWAAVGRAEGEARMLFAVLEERQLEITEEHRTRILACRDVAELERWTRRAVTVKATEELFE